MFTYKCPTCGEPVLKETEMPAAPYCDGCNPITPELTAEIQAGLDAQWESVNGPMPQKRPN